MKKSNAEPLSEQFKTVENKMRALYDAGIRDAEFRKVQDEAAVLIFTNRKKILSNAGNKVSQEFTEEDRDDLIQDLIVLVYENYDVSKGGLYPFVTCRLKYLALDKWEESREKLDKKDQKKTDQAEEKPHYRKIIFSLENFTRTYEDSEDTSEYIIPDEKMDQESDTFDQLISDEAFLNLSALVTCFFEERDRRSGTKEGFRYYKAAYTKSVFDYVKGTGTMEPPEFQHEADIIKAADVAFANFVTLYQPYSSEESLAIRKIFFNELERNRAISPSYVKNENPDDEIAIPMKPFVIGGFMERVHHMKVSPSLVSQQMSRYKDDAAEALHQIGIDSGRRKKGRK